MKLTVILFVFWPGEENYIEACLKSVFWVDEIVVIDNGASPKTLEIVKKYTNKIYKSVSDNFADRHNLGKEQASGDWILYIDADERVSRKLAEEIKKIDISFSAYELRRVNYFLGKEVKHGDRIPDFVARLFRKDKLLEWTGEIHESSKVNGKIGQLDAPLYHLTHRNIFSMMEKTINFSEHEAQLRFKANHPSVVWWRLIRVFLGEFYLRIIKYQGWRGGTENWIDGIFQSFSLFIVYARLWELQRKPKLEESYKEIDKKILSGEI
ncbi:glycosyltransferase family 2 protein [Candidatus Gottesmanbacteria bacterium]|nr:glycosyltransferase family 2 protein [Candidatus Gottesmanbacteria bacterium]